MFGAGTSQRSAAVLLSSRPSQHLPRVAPRLKQPKPHRGCRRLAPPMTSNFVHGTPKQCLDRVLRDTKRVSDFEIGCATGDEPKGIKFPRAQWTIISDRATAGCHCDYP